MNRLFRLKKSFRRINGLMYCVLNVVSEIAKSHTKSSGISRTSNFASDFRLSGIAVALLAALSVPAAAENIIYDDTNTTNPGLQIDPNSPANQSFFPTGGTSLTGNNVTVNTVSGSTPVPFRVYGGVTTGSELVTGNTVFINPSAQVGQIVYGGFSASGSTTGNTVNMSGGTVLLDVRGGVSTGASGTETSNNATIMTGGTIKGSIYGGLNNNSDPLVTLTGDVTNNRITISGGTVAGAAYAGYNVKGSSTNNALEITNGTVTGRVHGGYIFDSSSGGAVTNNTVTVSGGATLDDDVYGALIADESNGGSGIGSASGNTVTINGGTVRLFVYGAYNFAGSGSVSGNSVTINDGMVGGNVYGGRSYSGVATGNTVNINGGVVNGEVFGSKSITNVASNNTVNISGGTVGGNVYGGYTDANPATDNTINISGAPTLTNSILYGGFQESGKGNVVAGNTLIYSGNYAGSPVVVKDIQNFQNYQFNLSGVQAGNTIFSNDAGTGPDMTGSTVSITAPSITMPLGGRVALISKTQGTYAGPTELAPLTGTNGADYSYLLSQSAGNPLSLFLSKLATAGDLSLTGPYAAIAGTGAGESVTLDVGGTLTVDGALSMTSNATNAAMLKAGTLVTPSLTLTGANTSANIGTLQVSQSSAVNLDATSAGNVAINGLAFSNRSALTVTPTNGGNMTFGGNLSVAGPGNTLNTPIAYNAAGKAISFDLTGMTAGATMLSVTGSKPDLTGATLSLATRPTNLDLDLGDRVTFITASSGLTGNAVLPAVLKPSTGLVTYELGVAQTQNDLFAEVTSVSASEQSKALLEGQVAGLAFATRGGDLVAGTGLRAATDASQQAQGETGYSPFVAMSGGSLRYTTGSSVDVSGINMMMGLAAHSTHQDIEYLGGAFFEMGLGNYSTFNSFVNSPDVRGIGDTDYQGGGILGRVETPYGSGRLYGEASLRAGRVDNQFNTSDIMPNAESSSYDISSPYVGAHGGVGYEFAIASGIMMDVSDRLLWTQQDGESATVNDHLVQFDSANSVRNRLGARFSGETSWEIKPYVGAYWEHEFDGKQNGSVNGNAIDAPTLEGDTGIAELGFTLLSSKNNLNIDAGVQGYVGRLEDMTGSLRARWDF